METVIKRLQSFVKDNTVGNIECYSSCKCSLNVLGFFLEGEGETNFPKTKNYWLSVALIQ